MSSSCHVHDSCSLMLNLHLFPSYFQERTKALADNRPLPALYNSGDVRPLKMEDFKSAHEQVCMIVSARFRREHESPIIVIINK